MRIRKPEVRAVSGKNVGPERIHPTGQKKKEDVRTRQKKAIKKALFLSLLFFFAALQSIKHINKQSALQNRELVILLHGLARTERSMLKLENRLSSSGYAVVNTTFPSTKHPIEYLSDVVLEGIIQQYYGNPQQKIHFVTHSFGGIIIRFYLKHHTLPNLGRTVMISPPNQGSELVDRLKNTVFFKKFNGPAGSQLGTDKDSLPLNLGPVDFELGVISGNRSLNLINSLILPGPDDGIVSVEGTKVAGMKDFIVLPQSHTYIMLSEKVINQVIHFLKHGVFNHKTSPTYQ